MENRLLPSAAKWLLDHLVPLLTALAAIRSPFAFAAAFAIVVVTLLVAILALSWAYTRLSPAQQRSLRELLRVVRGTRSDRS